MPKGLVQRFGPARHPSPLAKYPWITLAHVVRAIKAKPFQPKDAYARARIDKCAELRIDQLIKAGTEMCVLQQGSPLHF
jgi:hypothetical protein